MKVSDLDNYDSIPESRKSLQDILGQFADIPVDHMSDEHTERGIKVLEAALNFFNSLEANYGEEVAVVVERKFCNAVKAKNTDKFERQLKESINGQKK
ncbi:MAG: hypothetical protein CMN60_20275 [Sphingobium sp.]|nr:hypothetical protein [Sphingobium sp.]|tara:strand:+ start:13729 stop:14022 length:294 start_codon:yes stop_codon:yes gene_type:complete